MKTRNHPSLVLLLLALASAPTPFAWGAEPAAAAATAAKPADASAAPASGAPSAAADSGEPRQGEVALPFKRAARKPIGASLAPASPAASATSVPAVSAAAASAPAEARDKASDKATDKAAAAPAHATPTASKSAPSAKPAASPSGASHSTGGRPASETTGAPASQSSAQSPAAARSSQDPLDALRDKLAQRLSARSDPSGKSSVSVNVAPTAPGEFQLKIQQAPAKASGATATGGRAARSTAASSVAHASHGAQGAQGVHGSGTGHGPHWAYDGAKGPQAWGTLHPDFHTCDRGQRQSPIDIRGGLPLDLEPLQFDYRDGFFSVVDNGHTLDARPAAGNSLVVGTRRFELQGLHFHRPAEERIDGKSFAMSVHLVHKDAQGRLAVVGLLVEEGPENPAVQTLWNHIPLERGETTVSSGAFNPVSLLPAKRGYYNYMGSLTTPPCTEGVLWMVMQTPITLSAQQLATFARLYAHNARPIQPDHGRIIKQSR